jgi:hypothetical protein
MTVGAFQFHAINPKVRCESAHDTETGILLGIPRSAMCVQRFDDSLNSAIHITYRISLRSSSMREPRDPLLKVVLNKIINCFSCSVNFHKVGIMFFRAGITPCLSPKMTIQSKPAQWKRSFEMERLSFGNDPSAGSPTETLLRLLLPLNDQVCPTSRQKPTVANQFPTIQRTH